MSKELGNTLAKKLGVSPEEQLKGFLSSLLQGRGQTAMEIAQAALSFARTCQRHRRPVAQRGWRAVFF